MFGAESDGNTQQACAIFKHLVNNGHNCHFLNLWSGRFEETWTPDDKEMMTGRLTPKLIDSVGVVVVLGGECCSYSTHIVQFILDTHSKILKRSSSAWNHHGVTCCCTILACARDQYKMATLLWEVFNKQLVLDLSDIFPRGVVRRHVLDNINKET